VSTCQSCNSDRLVSVSAKCDDRCSVETKQKATWDYVPRDMGLGADSDYVRLSYCLACGQIQGKWPLPLCILESSDDA